MADRTDWVGQWKDAAEAGDAERAARALAEDAVLISPITERFTFRGRAEVRDLLVSVFEVFRDIRFTDDVRADRTVALFATGTVGDTSLHEAQRLRLDGEGRIAELTLFMRPVPALTGFVRALGPRVARAQARPGVAGVLTVAGAFLDTVAATGDRRFFPLARPGSARAGSGRPGSARARWALGPMPCPCRDISGDEPRPLRELLGAMSRRRRRRRGSR